MPIMPGAADVLATPVISTVVQNTVGAGAAISYQVVSVNALNQDSVPSTAYTTPATNNATPNNTIYWANVPGAYQSRILKNGNLLATVAAGVNFYVDSAGSTGTSYTATLASAGNPFAYIPAVAPDALTTISMTTNGNTTQVALAGTASVGVVLTGTWTGTITPEVSVDGGTTWAATQFYNPNTQTFSATVTANGTYQITGTGGASHAHVKCTASMTGTVTGTIRASAQNQALPAQLAASTAVIGAVTVQATSGVALTADQTNTILRASLYVKQTAAGDQALTLGQSAMATSIPVTVANNQTAVPIGVTAGTSLVADRTNTVLRTSLYATNTAAGDTGLTANAAGQLFVTEGGKQTTPIAASAAAAAIKAGAGTLHRILVTTTATVALLFYDSPTQAVGTIIGYIPTTAAIGQSYDIQVPAATGIWCASTTNTPGVTVSWT